ILGLAAYLFSQFSFCSNFAFCVTAVFSGVLDKNVQASFSNFQNYEIFVILGLSVKFIASLIHFIYI
ncbi:hypothetical protein WUBG_05981, partial [Wuchereria bancrofti]